MGIKHEYHKYLLLLKSYPPPLTPISCCPVTGTRMNWRLLLLMSSEESSLIWYYTKLLLEPNASHYCISLSCSQYIWYGFLWLEPAAHWTECVPRGWTLHGTLWGLVDPVRLAARRRTLIGRAGGTVWPAGWRYIEMWKQINATMFSPLKAVRNTISCMEM